MARIVKQFVTHVVPGVVRPARILWNELMAFVFFALAIMGGSWVYRKIRADGPPDAFHELLGIGVGAIFALFMAYFAISSWWKARRISRS